MKKIILITFLLASCSIFAQNMTITISNKISIPDTNFLKALIQQGIDSNKDGKIQVSEAKFIENLDLMSSKITDLTGIEYFVNLKKLICTNNQLTSLDV